MECQGSHRYFVCETGTSETSEGFKVIVLMACTACGEPLKHEFVIGGKQLVLANKKEKSTNA